MNRIEHAGRLLFRGALALAALISALALTVGPAHAATTTKTVPGTLVFLHGAKPDAPGNCSAVVFAQWKEVPNTLSAKATWVRSGDGAEFTESATAPDFHDTNDTVIRYQVPAGSHWIAIGFGSVAGAQPNDCSEMSAKQRTQVRSVRIELTIDGDTQDCIDAKAKVKRYKKTISKANNTLKRLRRRAGSGGRDERAIRRNVAIRERTTRALIKARQDVRRLC